MSSTVLPLSKFSGPRFDLYGIGLKQFDPNEAAGERIAVADIMLEPGRPEIASAIGQTADHCLYTFINAQITIERLRDNIIMKMPKPAGAIPGLHRVLSSDPRPFILDQHSANGAPAFLALTHGAPFLQANPPL